MIQKKRESLFTVRDRETQYRFHNGRIGFSRVGYINLMVQSVIDEPLVIHERFDSFDGIGFGRIGPDMHHLYASSFRYRFETDIVKLLPQDKTGQRLPAHMFLLFFLSVTRPNGLMYYL
jgi:hypothetical protein